MKKRVLCLFFAFVLSFGLISNVAAQPEENVPPCPIVVYIIPASMGCDFPGDIPPPIND